MRKQRDVCLQTDRLVLRLITQNDLQDVFETMNFENTARLISFLNWPMTMAQAQAWCDQSEVGVEKQTDYLFIARDKAQNPVGCIGLHDLKTDSPETGYWVSELHQGQGYASEMLASVVAYAFEALNLKDLHATVIPDNLKSLKLLQKNGFEVTGKITKSVAPGKIAERYALERRNLGLE